MMRRTLRELTALAMSVLMLAGCASAAPAVPAGPEQQQAEADVQEAAAGTFSCGLFEITIPQELVGIVDVETSEDRIDVYHKESKDAGFGGLELSVWAVSVPKEYAGGPYKKIGELSKDGGSYDVVRGYPTEIQWDYNLPEMPESFEKLDEAADAIIASVKGINGADYLEGAGMKGEDLYGDVLAKYVTAVNEAWDANKLEEENMSPEFFYIGTQSEGGMDNIGFAYRDINSDGIDELFVGEIADGEFMGVAYDVYTMVDRAPAHVISGTARDRYYDYEDSFLNNEWSGGAGSSGCDVYALMANSTELVYQYGVKYDEYENEENPWFKAYNGGEYEALTEEEYNKEMEIEDNYVRFDYAPLSSFTAPAGDGSSEKTVSSALPPYEYPGPELFYTVLYKFLIDEYAENYDKADVTIPCPIIIAEDESNRDDIRIWGDFWIMNYNLNGDTLEMVSGGSYPGLIHVKSTDSGYEVTEMEVVGDGSDYDPTAKKIFGDHYDEFTKSTADIDGREATRAQIIANYVAANNLPIKAYKDYGWDPVTLPEENIDNFYSILD
ncbi:MAG: hypothetical protein K6G58_06805 [Lachnospiraceae bacterium]|nr:hypothetical protein [Lachnospiraceae bacterium]